jgi:hypothetical protein
MGAGFIVPPGVQPIIKFGDNEVKEIYSLKRNVIVVETPSCSTGLVKISISFDKLNYYQSENIFQYIDANSKNDVALLLKSLNINKFDIKEKIE